MRRGNSRLSLLLLWPVALACEALGHRDPAGARPSNPNTDPPAARIIAIIGSSTASGFGLSDTSLSWVNRYAAELHVSHSDLTVRCLAVPGYSTFELLPTGSPRRWFKPHVDPQHNVTAALAEKPLVLIVNVPSNDANAGYDVADTMANLHAVVRAARDAGVPTWISTSQPRNLNARGIRRLRDMRRGVLQDFGDHALDFWTPLAAPDGTPLPQFNQGDGTHPNAEGHRLLFEVVRAADIPGRIQSTSPPVTAPAHG